MAIGSSSGTTTSMNNTISIGNHGFQTFNHNYAFVGNSSTTWNGGNVQWGTFSDARIKTNITEEVKGLDFITRLRPVTYYRDIDIQAAITGNTPVDDYPEKYDIEKIKFSGFLAQEVDSAAAQCHYNFSGVTRPAHEHELYTLSYESFVVPLVKAVQEQQGMIDALQKENAQQRSMLEEQVNVNRDLLERMRALEESVQRRNLVGSKSADLR